MKVDLGEYQEAALLSLAVTFSVHATERVAPPPILAAADAILKAVRSELMRRWRGETGRPIGIELPRLDRPGRERLRGELQSIVETYRQILAGAAGIDRPFLEEAMQLTERLRLGVVGLAVVTRR